MFSSSGTVSALRIARRTSTLFANAPKTAKLVVIVMRRSTPKRTAAGGSGEEEGEGVVVAVGLPVAEEEREG